jgi:hypothetical protein
MALRLRRGTDAERLTITPVEGELIYTTDFQELWIGDGTTTGGNKIGGIIPQFLTDLDNVNAASPEIGQVLKWDGSNWVASTDENTGVVEDASYKINILGTSNTTIVDSDTATFTGSFVGDGSGLTNLPIATDGSGVIEGSNYRINIVDDSSTLMVNTSTTTFTGNFVGDGSGLTNVPSGSVFDLNDVFAFTPPDPGDILTFDGANFVPRKIRRIEGIDSTIIVDAFTNTFTGNFVGDGSGLTNLSVSEIVEGDSYRINIVGEDGSTIIVDSSSNQITADMARINEIEYDWEYNTQLIINNSGINEASEIVIRSDNNTSRLFFNRRSETDISEDNIRYGQILFGRSDVNGSVNTSRISANKDFIWIGHRSSGLIENSDIFYIENGNFGVGTITPEKKLDINGDLIVRSNGTFTGTVDAASFKGSVVADDSTTIVDAINGTISASSFIRFGSLTTLERNLLIPENGMVIYNTTDNKFQGYQNNGWINLDGS